MTLRLDRRILARWRRRRRGPIWRRRSRCQPAPSFAHRAARWRHHPETTAAANARSIGRCALFKRTGWRQPWRPAGLPLVTTARRGRPTVLRAGDAHGSRDCCGGTGIKAGRRCGNAQAAGAMSGERVSAVHDAAPEDAIRARRISQRRASFVRNSHALRANLHRGGSGEVLVASPLPDASP